MREKSKKLHLIGIAGISMSGLTEILTKQGFRVSGCDLEKLKIKNSNVKTHCGHSPNHIAPDLKEVIFSAAITPNSPGWEEVKKAKELGIPVVSRSKLVGRLMQDKTGIAVAGAHGKTTVSAMLVLILKEAGFEPTFLIGGEVPGLGKAALGRGKFFIAEACEYERQFLDFRPKIALITNIEEEHLDTYPGGLKEIRKAFKKFVRLLPPNGLLILWEEDPATSWLKKCAKCRVKTFSIKKPWPGLKLKIPGRHNLLNAAAAARLCHELGVSSEIIKKALNNFPGVRRRFEIKGEKAGVLVIDDYAHHPSEIQATLKAARESYPNRRIICIFQPHQYFRTKALLKKFGSSFNQCAQLFITDIFVVPGRERITESANKLLIKELVAEIKKEQKNVVYLPAENEFQEIVKKLKKEIKPGDLVLTMGATKIYQAGEELLRTINE